MPERARISLDTMFLAMADVVSRRSTCALRQVGAVIARDGRTISTGYNGAPTGEPHCSCLVGHGPCPVSIHAELNALVFAARNGTAVEGAILYVTHDPCYRCAGHLINAGISKVVFSKLRHELNRDTAVRLRGSDIPIEQHGSSGA